MLMVVASLVLLRLGWEAARAQAADSLLGAGMRRVQAQDLAGARDAFGRAADLDPWNGKAWLDAGTASLIAGDLEGAVAALGRAEALSGDPSIPYNLGLAWSALDRPDRARASLARAVSLRPAFPEALTSLADFEWRERRFREAEVLLKRALRAAPDSLPARRLLGFVYYHQGMRREALDQFIVYALHEPGDAKVEAMLQRIRREGIRGSGEKKR
jgi:tetratricopeptide (TPR) repeat protein